MIYLILIVYLGFTFWGSLIGSKSRNETPEAYFLADRNLGVLSLFFTILATNFSAFYFLGFAGQGYTIGYAQYIIMALGTGFAGLSFLIIGPKVWALGKQHGYITPSELIYGKTKSRSLSSLVSLVMIVFTLPYLALQIVGGGYILENLTGGDISYSLAIVLLTIFTIVYVVIGGMSSVAKTDLKQGLLVILFMFLAVVLVGNSLGGITAANEKVFEIKPELFNPSGSNEHYGPKKWFSFIIFWIFCIPMFPQLFMRFYIASDVKTLKTSAILYALIPIFISILPVMIGVWGHLSFPGLVGKEADQILPMMLSKHVSEWFTALIMTGAIAAFMSTLDSQLLALSTMITRDFYIPSIKEKPDFKREVLIGRIAVGLLAIIGLLIAFNPFDTIFDMGKLAFSGLAVLFPAFVSILFFRKCSVGVLVVGILLAILFLFLSYYKLISADWCFGFESFIVGILIAGVSSVVSVVVGEELRIKN